MTTMAWDDYTSADEYVGARINQVMFRQKVTRRELGEALKVDGPAVSRKLRGQTSWKLDELLAAARFLDVSLDELLPGDEYDPVLSGRGRGVVRHQGLEPRTRWLGPSLDLAKSPATLLEPCPDTTPLRLVWSRNVERAPLSSGRARPALRLIVSELAS